MMRNKKAVEDQIRKIRILQKSKKVTEDEKDKLWCVMIALEWIISKNTGPINPCTICVPRMHFLKARGMQ